MCRKRVGNETIRVSPDGLVQVKTPGGHLRLAEQIERAATLFPPSSQDGTSGSRVPCTTRSSSVGCLWVSAATIRDWGHGMALEMRPIGFASKHIVADVRAAGSRRLRAHRRQYLRPAVPDRHHETEGKLGAPSRFVPLRKA